MRMLWLVVAVIALSITGTSMRAEQTAMAGGDARFVGTWRLVSIAGEEGGDPRGEHPKGVIYYDATGHMAAQIMPERPRPKYAAAQPTPEGAKAAVTGYTAYFGTYTVDTRAGTVAHHREGSINPGQVGVDAVRAFRFETPDTLILTPIENPKTHLTWQRIR